MSRNIKLSELINPTARQSEFLLALDRYKYLLYGGAKSGGKSYILRWALIKLLLKWAGQGHRNVRVGLFCENFPVLKDRQVTKIATEFPDWLGKLSESNVHGLSFVLAPAFGGGIIALRNIDDPSKYASSEFAAIAIDELTKNPAEVFSQFRSIVRWKGIEETKIFAGSNPGGIGHAWVKKLWIDRDFPKEESEADRFHFVKALVSDNPHVAASYIRTLEALPEGLRKAYLEGSWDIYEGQFFNEWREDKHVVTPFQIPDSWRKFRTIDHGRTKPTAGYWVAVDHDGTLYVYREHYRAGQDADQNAMQIAEASINHETQKQEPYAFTLLDSACFSKQGGETIAEIYERNGVQAQPWPKNRKAGWNLFHEYLRHGEEPDPEHPGQVRMRQPKLRFFSNCKHAIRTIPSLVFDDNDPEDLDSNGEDHAADAIRGALEFLHEGRSPLPKNPLEQTLENLKRHNFLTPKNLKNFYRR